VESIVTELSHDALGGGGENNNTQGRWVCGRANVLAPRGIGYLFFKGMKLKRINFIYFYLYFGF
jgi:hypothetical protein